jgi:hypothetical protein
VKGCSEEISKKVQESLESRGALVLSADSPRKERAVIEAEVLQLKGNIWAQGYGIHSHPAPRYVLVACTCICVLRR